MYTFLITVHVLAAFVLILAIVVFQTSKGSALAMFGGGGDSLFNSGTGTSFIKKVTMAAGAVFAATSLMLTIFASSNRLRSVVQEYPLQAQPAPAAAPAQPANAPAKTGAPAPAPATKAAAPAQPAPAVPSPEKK